MSRQTFMDSRLPENQRVFKVRGTEILAADSPQQYLPKVGSNRVG